MPEPERGEIWRTRLDPTEGDEIGKTRPAVVINLNSIGRLNLRVVVPITDWKDRFEGYPWITRLEPDSKNGLDEAFRRRCFSDTLSFCTSRFVSWMGRLSEADITAIAEAIALMSGYELPIITQ